MNQVQVLWKFIINNCHVLTLGSYLILFKRATILQSMTLIMTTMTQTWILMMIGTKEEMDGTNSVQHLRKEKISSSSKSVDSFYDSHLCQKLLSFPTNPTRRYDGTLKEICPLPNTYSLLYCRQRTVCKLCLILVWVPSPKNFLRSSIFYIPNTG